MLSEKFAQTHNLQSTKYHVPGKCCNLGFMKKDLLLQSYEL